MLDSPRPPTHHTLTHTYNLSVESHNKLTKNPSTHSAHSTSPPHTTTVGNHRIPPHNLSRQSTSPNHVIGDAMGLPKSPTTTCLYFQNINGITVTNPSTWDAVCTDIQHMEVDIALLAEHKLDTTQPWGSPHNFMIPLAAF